MTGTLTRIIGLGNPLMGDDGVAVAAIERLRNGPLPAGVAVVDGGCAGLTLLQLLEDCRQAIIVDAADFKAEPGTIRVLRKPDLTQLAGQQGAQRSHQPGLQEVLLLAGKLDGLPPLTLILVQVESCRPQLRLSAKVRAALPELIRSILAETAGRHSVPDRNWIRQG